MRMLIAQKEAAPEHSNVEKQGFHPPTRASFSQV